MIRHDEGLKPSARRCALLMTGVVAGALTLAACGRPSTQARAPEDAASTSGSRAYAETATAPSSTGSGDRSAERTGYERRTNDGGGNYAQRAPRAPVPMYDGEPMWSDSRTHTAQENAHYHCDKSGGDIGANSFDDCLKKVHAFLDHPPADALKLKRARNGDNLIYDPKANLFAVARQDGAPRTFFKPRDGMDYWKQQETEAQGGGQTQSYGSRTYGQGSGGGYGRSTGGRSASSDDG